MDYETIRKIVYQTNFYFPSISLMYLLTQINSVYLYFLLIINIIVVIKYSKLLDIYKQRLILPKKPQTILKQQKAIDFLVSQNKKSKKLVFYAFLHSSISFLSIFLCELLLLLSYIEEKNYSSLFLFTLGLIYVYHNIIFWHGTFTQNKRKKMG